MLIGSTVFAGGKKSDPRLDMMEARFTKFKKEFSKACDSQVKAHKDLKNTDSYCGCMVDKHHAFLVEKIKGNEKINVPKYLEDLLKIYKGQSSSAGEDDIGVLDLDAEMAEECLAK